MVESSVEYIRGIQTYESSHIDEHAINTYSKKDATVRTDNEQTCTTVVVDFFFFVVLVFLAGISWWVWR
jgi:hypothetical protein